MSDRIISREEAEKKHEEMVELQKKLREEDNRKQAIGCLYCCFLLMAGVGGWMQFERWGLVGPFGFIIAVSFGFFIIGVIEYLGKQGNKNVN